MPDPLKEAVDRVLIDWLSPHLKAVIDHLLAHGVTREHVCWFVRRVVRDLGGNDQAPTVQAVEAYLDSVGAPYRTE